MSRHLVCRKCSGLHLTIKCGKDNNTNTNDKNTNINTKANTNANTNANNTPQILFGNNCSSLKQTKSYNNFNSYSKNYPKKVYRIKITELPNNVTEEEMFELTQDWGDIIKIKVLNYFENSVVYIDFKYENQADYFIKALDKTPFEYLLISVTKVDSN